MSEKKYSINNMLLAFIAVLIVIGLVALAGFFLLSPPDEIIMGQAEATQGRVGVGPHGMPQHVDHPVGGLALRHEGVQGPGGGPHDVAARLVVRGGIQCNPRAVDQGPQTL